MPVRDDLEVVQTVRERPYGDRPEFLEPDQLLYIWESRGVREHAGPGHQERRREGLRLTLGDLAGRRAVAMQK